MPAAARFADLASNRPMLAIKTEAGCDQWAEDGLRDKLRLVDFAPFSVMDRFVPGRGGGICLFRYAAPVDPAEIDAQTASAKNR